VANKLNLKTRTAAKQAKQEAFVSGRNTVAATGPSSRLTIDLPVELHRKLKAHSALAGRKMNELLREAIEQIVR